MTTDNFCFYLEDRLIQASQTGGQQYRDTSPFSIPWNNFLKELANGLISKATWIAIRVVARLQIKATVLCFKMI